MEKRRGRFVISLSAPMIVLIFFAGWIASAESRQVKSQPAASEPLAREVKERLRNRIEAAGSSAELNVSEELIHASVMLPVFYQRRGFRPAWSGDLGPTPRVNDLLQSLRKAEQEGLRPEDYHLDRIGTVLTEMRRNQKAGRPLNPGRLADLELLCTDAFLIFGAHLLKGKVNPESIDSEWFAQLREREMAQVLESALETNRISGSLDDLLPQQPGYQRLKQALVLYRDLAEKGGWLPFPGGGKMEIGNQGERILHLRRRLMTTRDLPPSVEEETEVFDEALDQAVRRFQERYGLGVDGVIGPKTLEELNVPVEDRIRQIELNLERWRWLPQDLGNEYIIVNIANFGLEVVKEGQTVLSMKVVVGKEFRRTPVFSAKVTYLVFNPFWNIPTRIAVQDKLPLIKKDWTYLEKQKIRVFQGWGAESVEIDPKTIDWERVNAGNFIYRLRQDPGPFNALGRVKFMLPNKFDVYLHDTPSRELFAQAMRAFSSGCIRLERPIDLAEYVLQPDPTWTKEKVLSVLERSHDQTVTLPRSLPVHLQYWTAWVDDDGTVQFRKDIYGRDKRLNTALHERAPSLSKH